MNQQPSPPPARVLSCACVILLFSPFPVACLAHLVGQVQPLPAAESVQPADDYGAASPNSQEDEQGSRMAVSGRDVDIKWRC
jgi:hypothetical protein